MKRNSARGLILLFILGFFPGIGISGLSLEDLVGREQARILLSGEKPVLSQFKDPKPRLVPRNAVLMNLIEKIQAELQPGTMVETLHLYKKPPEAGKSAMNIDEEIALYNKMTALSTLAGLQYFSASRGVMRTFYESSSVIDNPSAKKPVPDPVFTLPPRELIIYARQKDLTFGDNIYQYDYISEDGIIVFTQQNLTSLSYGIFTAVGKNKLRSTIAVLDAEEYLLVYAASMAKAASLPGMKERVGNSFANRAEAILEWFSDQADKVFTSAN